MDMEQWIGFKLGKEYPKVAYCHPAYLTSMQSTCEMLGWMKHKLESRLAGETSITSDADDTVLMAESKELKSFWMKVKDESEKVALKLNIQKTKIMACGPITSWEIAGKTKFLKVSFGGLQNHCRW